MTFSDGPVRIVADDLTGALDAAAPFARPGRPVGVVLHAHAIPARSALSISSESRDLPFAAAEVATQSACVRIGVETSDTDALWFHKIDSVLRGHPFTSTAAMMRQLGLNHCFFAPAFPAMNRITRGGMHLVAGDGDWVPTEHSDLAASLRAAGLTLLEGASLDIEPACATVVDATTQADLDQAVKLRRSGNLLWVGSRALAESLAGPVSPVDSPKFGLVVTGTAHPATRAQVVLAMPYLDLIPDDSALAAAPGRCLLLDPVPGSLDPVATSERVRHTMHRISRADLWGHGIFVTGGATLSVVLESIGAQSLDCLGEIGPGLPLSLVRGGHLDGTSLVSKSGGFGKPALLRDLISGRRQTVDQIK